MHTGLAVSETTPTHPAFQTAIPLLSLNQHAHETRMSEPENSPDSSSRRKLRVFSGMGMAGLVLMMVGCMLPLVLCGQDTCSQPAKKPARQLNVVTVFDFFTTLTGVHHTNGVTASDRNNLSVYYNFTINNKIKSGKLVITNYYYTDLGLRDYQDSITQISEDQFIIKNAVAFQLMKSRLSFNLATNAKSQYFRHYEYRPDSTGRMERYLYTAYLSPGYRNFSCGLRFDFTDKVALELGVVNGKTTLIRNQDIFGSRMVAKLYGLEKGTRKKSEAGFNLVLTMTPQKIYKSLYMENFSQFNVNKADVKLLSRYRMDINNAVHLIFLKHFRLTLRTQCRYDLSISSKISLSNHFSVGFYLNNAF